MLQKLRIKWVKYLCSPPDLLRCWKVKGDYTGYRNGTAVENLWISFEWLFPQNNVCSPHAAGKWIMACSILLRWSARKTNHVLTNWTACINCAVTFTSKALREIGRQKKKKKTIQLTAQQYQGFRFLKKCHLTVWTLYNVFSEADFRLNWLRSHRLCRVFVGSTSTGPGVKGVPVSGQIQHYVLPGVRASKTTDNHGLEGGRGPCAAHDADLLQSRCSRLIFQSTDLKKSFIVWLQGSQK